MWCFVLKNGSWLVPSALCLALGAYGGFERMQVLTLERNAAIEQVAAEKAVNNAKAIDAIKTAKLEADHAAHVKALQEKANAQQVSIVAASRSDTCIHTAAARAFLGGLPSADKAGTGQPRSTPGADSSLPR